MDLAVVEVVVVVVVVVAEVAAAAVVVVVIVLAEAFIEVSLEVIIIRIYHQHARHGL